MRKTFSNIIYLYLASFVSYLFPIIVTPLISRILTKEAFGLVSYYSAIILFTFIVFDFGSTYTLTKKISINRFDDVIISGLVSNAIVCKLILYGTVNVAFIFSPYRSDKLIPLIFIISLFQALNPMWYFQGKEEIRHYTLYCTATKVLFMLGVVFFIKKETGYANYFYLLVVSEAINVLYGYRIIAKYLRFDDCSVKGLVDFFKAGFTMFLFSVSTSFYSTTNLMLLKQYVNGSEFAFYAGADRISKFFLSLFGPLSQAMYPKLSFEITNNLDGAVKLRNNLLYINFAIGAVVFIIVMCFSEVLVNLLLGSKYSEASPLLKILSIQYLITCFSRVLGVQWMLPLSMDSYFLAIVVIGAVANYTFIRLLVPAYSNNGMAWAFVLTELVVLLLMTIVLAIKKQLFIFQVNFCD